MNEWIACSEKLPEVNAEVLAYIPKSGMAVAVCYSHRPKYGNGWVPGEAISGYDPDVSGTPTHWRPLPEPPTSTVKPEELK